MLDLDLSQCLVPSAMAAPLPGVPIQPASWQHMMLGGFLTCPTMRDAGAAGWHQLISNQTEKAAYDYGVVVESAVVLAQGAMDVLLCMDQPSISHPIYIPPVRAEVAPPTMGGGGAGRGHSPRAC